MVEGLAGRIGRDRDGIAVDANDEQLLRFADRRWEAHLMQALGDGLGVVELRLARRDAKPRRPTGLDPSGPVDLRRMILEVHEVGGAKGCEPHNHPARGAEPDVGRVELPGIGPELDNARSCRLGPHPEIGELGGAEVFEARRTDGGRVEILGSAGRSHGVRLARSPDDRSVRPSPHNRWSGRTQSADRRSVRPSPHNRWPGRSE